MTFLIKKFANFLHSRGYISITNSDAINLLPGSVALILLVCATWFSDFTITLSEGSSFLPPFFGSGLLKILFGVPLLLLGAFGFVMFWHTKDNNGLPSKKNVLSSPKPAKEDNSQN